MLSSAVEPPKRNPTQPYNLPRQLTLFVGRNQEISEIKALLSDPACRLLTLVGPGGIGKTRLAIQAAVQVVDNFAYGVYFVALQSVQTGDFLVSAMADTLNVSLAGQAEPMIQLLNHLSDKRLLLLLDNFEQLLAVGGPTCWFRFFRPVLR